MEMYNSKLNKDFFNLSIDGLDIVAEEITPNESFNRRETARKTVIGGTQNVIRTNYMPRDFNIVAHFMIDPKYPDVYDNTFREWQSKPVEVISRHLGGKFNAEIILKKIPNDSPNYLRMEIQIIEIPSSKSNIPNDVLKIPKDKLSSTKITSKKGKKKTKKNNSSKKKKKKKKKKGSITKTKQDS